MYLLITLYNLTKYYSVEKYILKTKNLSVYLKLRECQQRLQLFKRSTYVIYKAK